MQACVFLWLCGRDTCAAVTKVPGTFLYPGETGALRSETFELLRGFDRRCGNKTGTNLLGEIHMRRGVPSFIFLLLASLIAFGQSSQPSTNPSDQSDLSHDQKDVRKDRRDLNHDRRDSGNDRRALNRN